jgi:signal peptidase I
MSALSDTTSTGDAWTVSDFTALLDPAPGVEDRLPEPAPTLQFAPAPALVPATPVVAPARPKVRNGRRRAQRRAMWALVGTLLTALLATAWMVTLRPRSLGGPAQYVLVKGVSMLPRFETGDLVITHPSGSYAVGEVIAYRVPKGDIGAGAIVIHRIVGGSAARGFVIKGDNNDDADEWRPKPSDILGKAWIHAPGVGRVLTFLRAPVPMASLAAGFTVAFVLFPTPKRRRRRSSRRGARGRTSGRRGRVSSTRAAPAPRGRRHDRRRRPSPTSRRRRAATSPSRTTRRSRR